MATAVQIAGGNYRPRHAIAHKYGSALYVRLWHRTNDELSVWKSTDDGATWAQAGGTVYIGNGSTFYPGCGTANGSIIYVTYWHFGGSVKIARYDMAADDWTTDLSGPTVPFSQWNQCGFRSDGTLIVVYLHTEETSPGSGTFQRKWHYWTSSSGSVALSTAWQTWSSTQLDYQIGPLVVAADDSAHFFYLRSLSGSSSADTQLMHRRLDSGGSIGSETVAYDLAASVAFNPRGGVSMSMASVDSVLYALTEGDGITDAPAMLHGAATGAPGTYTIHPTIATDQQGVAKISSTAWGTWPVSQSSGEYTGVQIGVFSSGAWGATETVNDGTGGEPTWTWWMVSPLGTDALGFVLDDYNNEWPWFMRHPVSAGQGPAARYYAF